MPAVLSVGQGQRRHLARLTPQAERPLETAFKADNNGTMNGYDA